MKDLIIFGTSKYTDLVEHYFCHYADYKVCGYTMTSDFIHEPEYHGKPVVPFEEVEKYYSPERYELFVAVGSNQINESRKRLYLESKARGYQMASFIHPKALVDPSAKIGEHCMIMENVVIHAFCEIGEDSIFFPSSAITHETKIGAHAFVSSGVIAGGCSSVGEEAFLGISSIINNHRTVGDRCFVAAGAVVTANLENDTFLNRNGRVEKIDTRKRHLLSYLLKG